MRLELLKLVIYLFIPLTADLLHTLEYQIFLQRVVATSVYPSSVETSQGEHYAWHPSYEAQVVSVACLILSVNH